MNRRYDGLITFDSTHQALQLESILDTLGLDFDIRPIPPVLSAGCGLAIEFHMADLMAINTAIEDHKIISKATYQKKDKQYLQI